MPSKKKWLFVGSRLSPFATHTPWLQNNGIWVEADPEQQVITTMQVHQGDQPRLPPSCIASLACVCMMAACPLLEGKKKKKEKFYTYPDVTHTHTPGQGRVNPERQEEKSGHQRRAKGQNSAGGGGEQTDLQNQPTRRNGPEQHRAHTPQHITEGTGGRIRDRMGISWWQKRNNKKIIARTQFIPKVPCVIPKGDRGQIQPHGHKQLFKFNRIRCTICSTSPNTKETIPAGKGHACCAFCYAEMQKVGAAATKMEFLVVQGGFTVAAVHLPRFSRDNRTSRTT